MRGLIPPVPLCKAEPGLPRKASEAHPVKQSCGSIVQRTEVQDTGRVGHDDYRNPPKANVV